LGNGPKVPDIIQDFERIALPPHPSLASIKPFTHEVLSGAYQQKSGKIPETVSTAYFSSSTITVNMNNHITGVVYYPSSYWQYHLRVINGLPWFQLINLDHRQA